MSWAVAAWDAASVLQGWNAGHIEQPLLGKQGTIPISISQISQISPVLQGAGIGVAASPRCAAHPLHRAGSSCWQNGSWKNNSQPSVCVRIAQEICFTVVFFLSSALRKCSNMQNTVKWKNFASLNSLNKACHEPGSSINPGKTALDASQWIFNNTNTTCVTSIARKMGTGLRGCWLSPKLSLETTKRQLCSEGAAPSPYAQCCGCKKWVLSLWKINKTGC